MDDSDYIQQWTVDVFKYPGPNVKYLIEVEWCIYESIN